MLKRFLLLTFIVLITGIVLVGTGLAVVQTRYFKDWLRDTVVDTVNADLNGTLQIGRIDGSLFTSLDVSDILLTSAPQDTVLYLPRLRAVYTPSRIWHAEVLVDSVQPAAGFREFSLRKSFGQQFRTGLLLPGCHQMTAADIGHNGQNICPFSRPRTAPKRIDQAQRKNQPAGNAKTDRGT